jgi:hypothetical protein
MLTWKLERDSVTPTLRQFAEQARNPRAIFAAAGRAVTNLFRKHLRELDRSRPNKLGGSRSHFWLALSRSVNLSEISDRGVTVSISDPRAKHKHTGGTIRAKRAGFLTIPIHPDAHGRSTRVLATELGIKLFAWGGRLMGQAGGDQGLTAYYVLKRSVYQSPDPEDGILPPDDQIREVALNAARDAFSRQIPKGKN